MPTVGEQSAPADTISARLILLRLFSLPSALLCSLLTFVFFLVARTMADPDIWWHLRNAQVLLQTHRFLDRDPYSFTAAGDRWINPEWLAELPFYAGWRLAGPAGVYLVQVLAIELICAGLLALCWVRSRDLVASVLATATAAVLSTVSFGPRTLLFGWLCLIAELAILFSWPRRPRLLWALPPLFLVWINTHGSWMIGLVLYALWATASSFPLRSGAIISPGASPAERRTFALIAALNVSALFLNPYSWRLVCYPFDMAFHQKLNIANVQEWHPLDLHTPRGLITLSVLALLAIAQLRRNREWAAADLVFLALGVYSALNYSRFLFLFAILIAPIAAAQFPARKQAPTRPRPALNAAILFLLVCAVFGRLRHRSPLDQSLSTAYPAASLSTLNSLPPQTRLFHEYLWGGFLLWNHPTTQVFIDSRVDLYEYNGTFLDYLDIIRLHNTLQLLDHYRITHVLYEPDTPLVYLLLESGKWRKVSVNGTAILLERAVPTSSPPCSPTPPK